VLDPGGGGVDARGCGIRYAPPAILRRYAIVSCIALSALATAWFGTRELVPRLGDAMARSMVPLASSLVTPRSTATGTDTDQSPGDGRDPVDAPSDGVGHRSRGSDQAAAAIDIPSERLARLSAQQLRGVSAVDAVDASGRAIGARLRGVGGLGVGLLDGDIVTSIDGHATTTVSDGTAAAMAAYASGEASAHATVLRGRRMVRVTVHIPARTPGSKRGGM
jgi:hypothetical protein